MLSTGNPLLLKAGNRLNMARQPRITICSNCLGDFPDKEMYTVSKPMMWGNEVGYYTPFCSKCVKSAKDSYIGIIKEPKAKTKRKPKK